MNSFGPQFSAIVIGASGGIGSALREVLAQQPACSHIVGLSRNGAIPIDLEDEASVENAAGYIRQRYRTFELIIDASGVLAVDGRGPEKALSAIDPAAMARLFAINATGPALLFKHFADFLPKSGRGVLATLSARVGSIGDNRLGGWYSYRASKAALNQIVRCAAIEIARKRPEAVCLSLHPGTVHTSLSKPFTRTYTHSAEEAAKRLLAVIDRATPDQSGTMLAYDGSTIPW